MIEVVPARLSHVGTIANRMRAMDQVEVGAFGHTPKQALRLGVAAGNAWTVLVDDRPEAMFGAVVHSVLSGVSTPWMLGTDAVYRHGRALLTIGPEWVERMFDSMPVARNIVSAGNSRAIRLLQRWGFVVEQDEIMVSGVAFRTFWKERG